jgi:hypothetical protein
MTANGHLVGFISTSHTPSMGVTMMDVGEVRVRVGNGYVLMRMCVRLLTVPLEVVSMQVVLVVAMSMIVLLHVMSVRMFVTLANMEPDAQRHQRGSNPE